MRIEAAHSGVLGLICLLAGGGWATSAYAIGTELSCLPAMNAPEHGTVILGIRMGHFTLCASAAGESCEESVSVSERLTGTASPHDDVSCDYRGETLAVLHQGADLYEVTILGEDGSSISSVLSCERTYACR